MEYVSGAVVALGVIAAIQLVVIVWLARSVAEARRESDARLGKTLDAALAINTFELDRLNMELQASRPNSAAVTRSFTVPATQDTEPTAEPVFSGGSSRID